MTPEALMELAREAMGRAYAPYSGFQVGAALLGESGRVYVGCNVENAAYGPTCCAERTAFFSAVAQGERRFQALAVLGGMGGVVSRPAAPCGVCRQVMAEFCPPDFPIYMGGPDGRIEKHTLSELLPLAFSGQNLQTDPA
ncbi:MAG TPA: cytidine deaminase [Candidatus Avoscillospira avicola]|uniref:Cytidine deaminase n=1 Tax=Candidatus Avoscillospira avicola TaxID=2840706 RepID=A0A9D1DGB1_9FIRM|nr:cytidine deaminase [Candidatus Avoscillospira avicola]